MRETFCSTCMRTVYRASDDGDSCPVCSSALVLTVESIDVDFGTTNASSPESASEDQRLAAIRRYEILDTPPDGAFDRVTSLAARIFDVPISTITLVDRDRIWFKSKHGIDAEEIAREPGLCASAVLHDGPWVVNDAAVDPRTLENALVRGDLGLRFYAGVPLTTGDSYNLGTINIIDTQPREMSDDELEMLKQLGDIVVDEMELRLSALRLYRKAAEQGVMLDA